MATTSKPEVWLRGPVPGISPFLQPVVHALLQAGEEVNKLMQGFPDALLWEKPAGLASPGFHLQHLTGVLDRLFTYSEGRMLSAEQMAYLKKEGTHSEENSTTTGLVNAFMEQVERSVESLKGIDEKKLVEKREVGRAQLPSTVLGLLFHAAEHTMRHTGQLLVTVNVLLAESKSQ
jgi:hypothetical protein